MDFPEGYWQTARHIYFRDHTHGGFGVLLGWDVLLTGPLRLHDAAAIALILNGDGHLAKDLLPLYKCEAFQA